MPEPKPLVLADLKHGKLCELVALQASRIRDLEQRLVAYNVSPNPTKAWKVEWDRFIKACQPKPDKPAPARRSTRRRAP